jgi:arylsulfatase A
MKTLNSGIIAMTGLMSLGFASQGCSEENKNSALKTPNFIIIFTDDLGYGDIGVFGHPTIKTPNLDRMAYEGQKWTQFYVGKSVCTPSRAALLTGRLPIRSGMSSDKRRVLFPDSNGGLPPEEITIASALKAKNYKTAVLGKWHLGHKSPFLPTDHGFDYYYGIPYSNDMDRVADLRGGTWITAQIEFAEEEFYEAYNVPIMRNKEIVERPADQRTITKRYTEEAVAKIKEFKDDPFFIYLAHSLPHIPLFRSGDFKDASLAGIYGDVIEEIDWSVGQIMETLKEEGLDENTYVIFTSDNGHWHIFETHGGFGGLLRGAKGGTFEGGMRVPAIFWGGKIKPGVVMELGTTMDLFPTFCKLAGVEIPGDREYDGYDISPLMFGTGPGQRQTVYYYRGTEVFAMRHGSYKAHFITQGEYGGPSKTKHEPPLLYNLDIDPSEKYDIATDHPEIITEIKKVLEEHKATIVPVENQLEK